jgi:hypothetical protein
MQRRGRPLEHEIESKDEEKDRALRKERCLLWLRRRFNFVWHVRGAFVTGGRRAPAGQATPRLLKPHLFWACLAGSITFAILASDPIPRTPTRWHEKSLRIFTDFFDRACWLCGFFQNPNDEQK